jgi:class 3 adenylate cyclase/tetratricopeptide (TPR) repeat protein
MVSAAVSRKTVSVLFCDLAGSTALGEQLDPEALRELMGSWYEAMRNAVEAHGGTVEKFVGDAVMAVFGLPQAHEDDALRAVRAALEMREAAGELVVRIGINTGEVVTGDELTTLVTGDAVNTAKRLEQAAGSGEILVGAVTEQLVRHAVRLEALTPVEAKGKSADVEAWRVLSVIAGAEPFARRWDTPLVGRQAELATLRNELEAAAETNECRLVTVLAAAGVGKTRLATELAAEVSDYATVLSGRCLAYGDGITFWPMVELLRAFGGEAAIAEAVRGEPDAELIVGRLRGLSGGGAGPAEELFWAVRRLFETLARRRPLVVVLEDVHWAEPTLLDLVEHVSRWSSDATILLLCIARPELLEERPRWEGTLIRLEPLSADEASTLLAELDEGGVLPPELRERVAETAQGNPLYVEQLVAMLEEDGPGAEISALPPTIQALLAARLDRLEPAEKDLLERAAVIGKEFWPGAVAALGEGGEPLGAMLLELVRLELVEPAASVVPGEDGFRFRHDLIRDAAYSSAPLRRRAAHHECFAEWLALEDFGEEYDEIRGYHLEQAVRLRRELNPNDENVAALCAEAHELLAHAGRQAHARGDNPAARNLLERSLALGKGEPELRRMLAQTLWHAGEAESAVELLDGVADDAAAAGDRAQEWYARLDAAVVGNADLRETAFLAVEVFSELDDERGLSEAWRRIARTELVRCSYAAAEAAAERALYYARRGEDRLAVARVADELATSLLWGPEPVDSAIPRCEELLTEAEGNEFMRANVLASLAGLRALESDFKEARRLQLAAEGIFRDLGHSMLLAGMTEIAAQIHRLAGDPAAAEAELRTGLELLGDAGGLAAAHEGWLASALVAQGRYTEAREVAEAARDAVSPADVFGNVVWRGALARVEAAAGNLDVALPLAREGVDIAAVTDGLAMRADALLDLSAVLSAAGDADEAALVEREAIGLYETKGRVFTGASAR